MATVVYKSAVVLIAGANIRASLNELSVEYSAEMLDETAFGDDTRVRKGGLKVATISAAGFAESGDNLIEPVIFDRVGDDDEVVSVYPDGITEGSQVAGSGFFMRGVVSEFQIGGPVGALLPLRFTVEGRGVEA